MKNLLIPKMKFKMNWKKTEKDLEVVSEQVGFAETLIDDIQKELEKCNGIKQAREAVDKLIGDSLFDV